MEQEAKRLLFERLDECLKAHAVDISSAEGAPSIGDIYGLQHLAQLHCYLKTEHEFTPAEVEELLKFNDPLDVARWCREENTHAHSFPICELLKEIDAYGRFRQADPVPSLSEKYNGLLLAMGRELFAYQEGLLACSAQALIGRCEEIATFMTAYRYMQDMYSPVEKEVDYLLSQEEPLKFVAGYWPDSAVTTGDAVICTLMDDRKMQQEERAEMPKSIRAQLQKASDGMKGRPAGERQCHGHDGR